MVNVTRKEYNRIDRWVVEERSRKGFDAYFNDARLVNSSSSSTAMIIIIIILTW